MRLVLLPISIALLGWATGCVVAQRSPQPLGHATPYVPGIRIIAAQQARTSGLTGRRFDLPFGDKQDGTQLVLDYLDQARRAGARYASDISIALVRRPRPTEAAGLGERCTTQLEPFAKRQDYTVRHTIPGHQQLRSVLKPVTQSVTESVTEYRYQCQMVSYPVTRSETSYQYQYDYASRSSRSVPVTRTVYRTEYRNECRSVPTTRQVTRMVTRYQHQLESHYVPPQVAYIAAHYTDFDLIESLPQCEPLTTPPDPRLPHRISGLIYPEQR